jgi:hypothetical protein
MYLSYLTSDKYILSMKLGKCVLKTDVDMLKNEILGALGQTFGKDDYSYFLNKWQSGRQSLC